MKIEEAYEETWNQVDALKAKYGRVYFIHINRGVKATKRIITKDVPRTTFAFDYAIANVNKKTLNRIRDLIRRYRRIKFNTEISKYKASNLIEKVHHEILKHPHVRGYWM